MSLLAVIVLLGTGLTVNSEKHKLTYIYTALSKPVGLPGIHEFTAMGLLDDRMIDYFDSTTQKKVPTQTWMKEKLSEDYWEKGTLSCQRMQLWFKDFINFVMKRMRQNDTDVHFLQWKHGCEGEVEPDGKFTFLRGINMYGYDGEDFLSFNYTQSVWVASVDAAVEIKMKWDRAPVLKEHTKDYMENECLEWLEKFVNYNKEQLRTAAPPELYLYARNAKVETNITLTCLATGFYPKDIVLNIKRDGRILTRADGVRSSGVRPNNDDTFQRLDHVEILKKDQSRYTCEVENLASRVHVEMKWDQALPESGGLGPIIGGVIVLLLVVVVAVLLVVFRKRIFGSCYNAIYDAGYNAGYDAGSLAGYDAGSLADSDRELAVISTDRELAFISTVATNGTATEKMTLMEEKLKGSEDSLNSKNRSDSDIENSKPPTPEIQSLMENKEEQV